MSTVKREIRNTHWLSRRTNSAFVCSLFRRIFARIFPAVESREMPRWVSQSLGSPFFLYIASINVSLDCCGSYFAVQQVQYNLRS